MSGKIKHCLIIPCASSIIQSAIVRIIICAVTACPAASKLLPDCGIIIGCFSNRNPGAAPVEHADCAHFVGRCTDIPHDRCLALNSCRISFYDIIRTNKTVALSISILRSIGIGCFCNHHICTIIFSECFCHTLHIFISSIPEGVKGKTKHIIIHLRIL